MRRILTRDISRHLPPEAATRHLKAIKYRSILSGLRFPFEFKSPVTLHLYIWLSLYSILHTQYSLICTFAQAVGRFALLH